jgi:hypothetical protein
MTDASDPLRAVDLNTSEHSGFNDIRAREL